MVKIKVISFWESKLRSDAKSMSSLKYFNSDFASLTKPHPVISTPGSNPYEVNKGIVQLRMLSGRYRYDHLLRHFAPSNNGSCFLCS